MMEINLSQKYQELIELDEIIGRLETMSNQQ